MKQNLEAKIKECFLNTLIKRKVLGGKKNPCFRTLLSDNQFCKLIKQNGDKCTLKTIKISKTHRA